MEVHFFSEMAHHTFPDEAPEQYASMRLVFPNTHFDRCRQHDLYKRYFDEYLWAEECGWDGLMINEHHSTPSCSNVSINMSAAVLARATSRAKILLMGNLLPVHENPVFIAEQIAMADQISGGRIISGFVRGIGSEYWWGNVNPVYSRERFQEAHDLILKCWTTPGPFRWEGRHFHYRVVNPWMLPYQEPHPPIWVPGSASPETAEWAGRMDYTFAPFLVPLPFARRLLDIYAGSSREAGHEPGPEKMGFMVCAVCADTEEKALEAGRHFLWRMGPTLRGKEEYFQPVGYRSRAGRQMAHQRSQTLRIRTYEELLAANLLIAGTPDQVLEKLVLVKKELGIGHLLIQGHESRMDHETTMRSIELIGKEVIPALKAA